jgi:hypothetical protein
MRKVKVQHNGQEIEIELPEGFGTREDFEPAIREAVQTAVNADFARRSASVTQNALRAALQDDAFKTEALQAWNIDLEKLGKPNADTQQQIADAVARAQKELVRTQVDPLNKTVSQVQTDLQKARTKILEKDILVAAREANVQDFLLKGVNGGPPAIVGMVQQQFGYDSDTDSWYVKAGDSFAVSTKATQGRLYQDVGEYFTQIAGDKDFSGIFKDVRQTGPGVHEVGSSRERAGVIANDPMQIGLNADAIASGKMTVAGP